MRRSCEFRAWVTEAAKTDFSESSRPSLLTGIPQTLRLINAYGLLLTSLNTYLPYTLS